MLEILRARLQQKHRTMKYPDCPPPELPALFAGRPQVAGNCPSSCSECIEICPTDAIKVESNQPMLDAGRCLFCRECERHCPESVIRLTPNYQLAAARRDDLIIRPTSPARARAFNKLAGKIFANSFKLRQVSAGGCNACEADCNVLGTPAWDMGRFGISFVASPRHADGILITGPVTENMREALLATYAAVPEPRLVIAVGACAINGGPYVGHKEAHDGTDTIVPVDLYIPGCPPHPLSILDGLLRFLGRVPVE